MSVYEEPNTNTWRVRRNILHHKILSCLGKRRMCDITSKGIITWQNEMMDCRKPGGKGEGQGYSPLTLRTLSGCMTALFNDRQREPGDITAPIPV